ncbi:hypothetical protein BUALT_Bualt07G0099200 [Buddleja alternifolia]|uniref:NB-ARC domain-containing protein n=1 Tax=Buddleja alternifolia TaxID=168488 RepID=A0AAV6X9P2_9LAMI|nr:hypothetical protein BUALT_Bualt07G0099200 [Buddleja alternifolia]
MVVSLTQELQELFVVPKYLIFPFDDTINNLKEELRCLVVLGDTTSLLGAAEIEQVENLLAEFEAVANEAGSLMYSLFFVTDIDGTGNAVGALFEHIELLKANIINFSNLPPPSSIIKTDIITPEAATVDSFSIIVSLLRDLEDLMNREDDLIVCQIKILHQGLMLSRSFLKDIKVLQLSEMEELKEIVMRIREGAYASEYLIHSLLFGDAPLWYLNIRIPNVIHKIKLIEIGIQDIDKNYDIGALKVAKDFSAQLSLQAKRNSDVEDIIVGLEDKTIDILDQLTGGKKHLLTIGIFGMPGLGKTTLAKKLYVHPTVNCYFDKLSWCIVSQAYQRKSVLVDILISLGSELGRDMIFNMREESLAECIYKSLKERSRNQDVAPPNSIIHALPTLSNVQCWELLEKKVFGNETFPPQLLDIGNQIASSCCGLPLAVVVVAGILSTMEMDKSTWENVGRSLASYIFSDKHNSTMEILELSYKHLPDHLKPCFLYFGAFWKDEEIPFRKCFADKDNSTMPVFEFSDKLLQYEMNVYFRCCGSFWKDKEIHVRTLKRLWIAEGFICKQEGKSLESVAEEYLMELIGKSLVIVTRRRSGGGVKYCVIHNLLRDLCSRRAKEENFLKLAYNNYSIYSRHQRLYAPFRSVSRKQIYNASHLPLGHYGRHVRSFIGYVSDSHLNVLGMELLRVLDCWNANFSYLVGIETLVHLRYLAIRAMPASIGSSLVNLEFLVVHKEVFISSSVLKLAKLRYLQAGNTIFRDDCDSTQMVTRSLEYVSTVHISNLIDEEMLKCTPHLCKLKCTCVPLFMDDEETLSYRYPDLRFLTELESLTMIGKLYGDAMDTKVTFPSSIKKLTLSGLELSWEMMSIIGALPNLEILKLRRQAFEGEIWETRCLQEIPCAMGEIETLQLIEVDKCQKSVGESATQIQEEQQEMTGNEDLRIIIKKVLQLGR